MTPGKRAMDIVIAGVLSVLALPIGLLIAVILRAVEGGPVFYISERMKTPDQAFDLIKFRTMRPAPPGQNTGVTGGDKAGRHSPFQAMLRRTRLDELPQLWNVLRGDISLIGPRPPLRQYVEAYPDLYAQVLQSRPGISGLASLVYHRHEARLLAACDTPEQTDAVYRRRCIPTKARLDLIYAQRRTLCYDLVLIARTAAAPFRHR